MPLVGKLAGALGLGVVLWLWVDWREAGGAIAEADPMLLGLAFLASVASVMVSARKWQGLLHRIGVRVGFGLSARGLAIDLPALERRLGVEVVPTVAVRHEGTSRLLHALAAARAGRTDVIYPVAVERAVQGVIPLLPAASVSPRALALMVLAGDGSLGHWLRERLPQWVVAEIERVVHEGIDSGSAGEVDLDMLMAEALRRADKRR